MRLLMFVLVAALVPVAAYGGPIRDSIDRAIEETPAPKGFDGIAAPKRKPAPLFDFPFVASQGPLWGSTLWDTKSTFKVLRECPGSREGSRILRPYVQRGEGAFLGHQAKLNAGVLLVSGGLKYVFRNNRHWGLRNLWVVPVAGVTGGNVYGSIQNMSNARSCRS